MSGLLRGMARTAMVAGTATAVSNRVSRRQAGRWATEEQAQPGYSVAPQAPPPAPPQHGYVAPPPQSTAQPAPAAVDMDVRISQLRELGALREHGVLTDPEFEAQKARILGS